MDTLHKTMLSMAIHAYGGPEVLQRCEQPVPCPCAGETLVRVAMSGVNPADGKWRAGMFARVVPVSFPYVPGYDLAGTVEDAAAVSKGSRVAAMLDNQKAGAYAQFVVVPTSHLAKIPDELDDDTAAAIPTAALTGFQSIDEHVLPNSGDRVLISGALGAVGRFALYAAKARGARVIAAVRASQQSQALDLGADETVVLGAPPSPHWSWDHMVDTLGGALVAPLCRCVHRDGKLRTVATTPIPADELPCKPVFIAVHPDGDRLSSLLRLVATRRISVPIARRLKLTEAADAHRLLDAGGIGGKIVLRTETSGVHVR